MRPEEGVTSKGPLLSVDTLVQASKVICSVPRNMSSQQYFAGLSPQLISLLDGSDGPDMSKAAAYIISGGILAKKSTGAPGSIGWTLFAEPIFFAFDVGKYKAESDASLPAGHQVTTEPSLRAALQRLLSILEAQPNPGLTGRLVGRILLPLWGLINYAKCRHTEAFWYAATSKILEAFMKLSAGLPQLESLANDLLSNGLTDRLFAPGSYGGIEIRPQNSASSRNGPSIMTQISLLERRCAEFVKLVIAGQVDSTTRNALLLGLIRRWLLPTKRRNTITRSLEDSSGDETLATLCTAKLVQELLPITQDGLTADTDGILELISQLLKKYIFDAENKLMDQNLRDPSYSGLAHIVESDAYASESEAPVNDSIINLAISFLDILASKWTQQQLSTSAEILQDIYYSLQRVQQANQNADLQLSLENAIALIGPCTRPSTFSLTPSANTTRPRDDRETARAALAKVHSGLTSELPPIRTEALFMLNTLINNPSSRAAASIIDTTSTTILLLETLRTENDEYVYRPAIAALSSLLRHRDAFTILQLVLDAFIDPKERESGVDARLRVGEAISNILPILTSLGSLSASAPDKRSLIKLLADAALLVTSRRGQRKRTLASRSRKQQLEAQKEARRRKETQEAWGEMEPPTNPALGLEEDSDADNEAETLDPEKAQHETEMLERIIRGWEDTGMEEDVRLRTSALSILGEIIETGLELCSQEMVTTAVDVALSVLTVERTAEKAILRRAAAVLPLALLRALDAALKEGRELEAGLEMQKWTDVEDVMGWVASEDEDEIVKGHAAVVGESLEAWRMNRVMGIRGSEDIRPRFGLEGRLRGLDVNVEHGEGETQRRPVIEEIE